MRVALVIEWLDAWRGGAESSTEQFIRHVVGWGVELTVFTRSRLPCTPELSVRTLAIKTPARWQGTQRFARRAAAAVREERYDVIHAISPCPAADLYEPRGGTVAETLLRNVALRPPGLLRELKRAAIRFNPKQRGLLRLERQLLGGPGQPLVVALSDYVVRQLRKHYNYPLVRIRKVFNGVEPDRTDAETRRKDRADIRGLYRIRDDDLLVLMAAHNFKLKGLRRWMEALEFLARGTDLPVRSLVVGKDTSATWERLAASKGLSGRIQFTGATRRMAGFFHAADILVHPTYYDPCSRVVLEALTAGLPVITTHYDGAAEVIDNGVQGYVVDEENCVRELADGVVRLADAELRAKMGAAGAQLADRVSMERHAQGVYQVYQEMVEAKSS